jgi:hypothetical protein
MLPAGRCDTVPDGKKVTCVEADSAAVTKCGNWTKSQILNVEFEFLNSLHACPARKTSFAFVSPGFHRGFIGVPNWKCDKSIVS